MSDLNENKTKKFQAPGLVQHFHRLHDFSSCHVHVVIVSVWPYGKIHCKNCKNFSRLLLPLLLLGCVSLATGRTEQRFKRESDTEWPGGRNVVHITLKLMNFKFSHLAKSSGWNYLIKLRGLFSWWMYFLFELHDNSSTISCSQILERKYVCCKTNSKNKIKKIFPLT